MLGEARTPHLALVGFSGPLALLLDLARAQQIALAHLSVVDLVDQLAAAVQQSGPTVALGEKSDWVVMASWLLLLRSRLLLPAETAAQQTAADVTEPARGRCIPTPDGETSLDRTEKHRHDRRGGNPRL